jgi:nucleotide-binding universal stress UspA family protein
MGQRLLYTSAMTEPEGEPTTSYEEEVAIVLAAVDNSKLTHQIVEMATRVARRTWPSSQLHLVHVLKIASFDRPESAGIHREELIADAQSYLDYQVRMARRQCSAPVTGHLVQGDPADEIVKCARSINADLLLVGASDKLGLERFLLGSVTSKVNRRSPCSVLTIRQKQRPFIKVPKP